MRVHASHGTVRGATPHVSLRLGLADGEPKYYNLGKRLLMARSS
jgi:hypothetical protein